VNKISGRLFEMFCALGVAPMVRVEEADDPINQKVAQ
jgi:hypothetical protein